MEAAVVLPEVRARPYQVTSHVSQTGSCERPRFEQQPSPVRATNNGVGTPSGSRISVGPADARRSPSGNIGSRARAEKFPGTD